MATKKPRKWLAWKKEGGKEESGEESWGEEGSKESGEKTLTPISTGGNDTFHESLFCMCRAPVADVMALKVSGA